MKLIVGDKPLNFPDILILGAAKCGTTSLAFFLKQHPDVYMPRKEPGFFAYHNRPVLEIPSGIRDRQITDLGAYSSMYEGVKPGQKICDSSVAQFTNAEHTVRNVKQYYGESVSGLKTVLILRHPVDRAYSHYLMFVKNGLETLSFEDAIRPENVKRRIGDQLGYDYLGGSLYAERVRLFKHSFPQLKIYTTEDLKKPQEILKDFLDFCGLNDKVSINTAAKLNPSGLPKKKGLIRILHSRSKFKEILKRLLPDKLQYRLTAVKSDLLRRSIVKAEIDPILRQELTDKYFKTDILELQKIVGRNFSNWLTQNKHKYDIPIKSQ